MRGVRYRDASGSHEVRAALTVAADGRHSDLRKAAGLVPQEFGAPMDVAWFRLPRTDGDPDETFLRLSSGHTMVSINRESYWQLAHLIPKGGFDRLRGDGIEALREPVARLLPHLSDRVGLLTGFDDVSVLTVAINRLRQWYLPGFLCIGDAAHAMSPVFGVASTSNRRCPAGSSRPASRRSAGFPCSTAWPAAFSPTASALSTSPSGDVFSQRGH